jgi:predicted dehydrogenase
MADQRKLRFGVIGAGRFAEACHVPGLQSHPRAEVVALCGRRYDHARAMADRLGVPDVHTDYRELCARADLNGVTIATPNAVHAEQALAAFRHDKHVLCEKPLGMTVAEALEMAHRAEASGKIHQVAFTFRYLYGVQELRRRMHAGDIGGPYYLRIQYDSWDGLQSDWRVGWRERRDLAGGGMLYDLGSHLFDLARFVLGPIEVATGFHYNIPRRQVDSLTGELTDVETDDIAAAWFRHETGIRGQWFISRATPLYAENGCLQVIGPEGALQAALSRGSRDWLKVSRPNKPEWEELPLPAEARDGKPHALGRMMHSFVDACLSGMLDGDIDASFYDGLAAQQGLAVLIEANDNLTWMRLRHTT